MMSSRAAIRNGRWPTGTRTLITATYPPEQELSHRHDIHGGG